MFESVNCAQPYIQSEKRKPVFMLFTRNDSILCTDMQEPLNFRSKDDTTQVCDCLRELFLTLFGQIPKGYLEHTQVHEYVDKYQVIYELKGEQVEIIEDFFFNTGQDIQWLPQTKSIPAGGMVPWTSLGGMGLGMLEAGAFSGLANYNLIPTDSIFPADITGFMPDTVDVFRPHSTQLLFSGTPMITGVTTDTGVLISSDEATSPAYMQMQKSVHPYIVLSVDQTITIKTAMNPTKSDKTATVWITDSAQKKPLLRGNWTAFNKQTMEPYTWDTLPTTSDTGILFLCDMYAARKNENDEHLSRQTYKHLPIKPR
jgi:hypothetical protein